jgi:putative tricarboxylic transport membrane protein
VDAFDNFLIGTVTLFSDPVGILIFFGGVIGGMLFGAIPGVSMLTLAAILLPFTAHLSPEHGIMLFSVIYCTGVYGGAITAILFNIPGAPENAPTAFDGYPMTQKGLAGKAVGAAVMCSAIGGVVSTIIMMLATAPIADWAISAFGPPEIFALVFFGLAVASSVGAKTFWKGWLSILIGLLVAVVGLDPVGGIERFDFEMPYLLAGIHFIPTILGFFAVSEIFVQAEKKARGAYKAPKMSVDFPSLAELIAHKWAVLRSIVIGFFCGILPGIGATLAAFMGYNEAVRWSKTPEEFGKGKLEGVISSETANNAATGAAMIPLLALGLPGGALTAMMVGVFQMHDMEPGPLVFISSHELV